MQIAWVASFTYLLFAGTKALGPSPFIAVTRRGLRLFNYLIGLLWGPIAVVITLLCKSAHNQHRAD